MTLIQTDRRSGHFDALIVGSGPGGALAAEGLVRGGARVLLLERGDWVARGPGNQDPGSVAMLSPHYSVATPMHVDTDSRRGPAGAFHCVGGQSVFYAAVAFRYRESDFRASPDRAGAQWPFGYDVMEPFYAHAERVLGVSGDASADPTEPWRSAPYAAAAPPVSAAGDWLHRAADGLGLRPFRPPLAIMREGGRRRACEPCGACNGHACATRAKGDAAGVLGELTGPLLVLRTRAAAVRVLAEGTRVTGVEYRDLRTGLLRRAYADAVILAAGALATPHLLLTSGLQHRNPGGRVVGRYLTRHCNAAVCGVFPVAPAPARMSYKEFAVHDFYHGHPTFPTLGGLGSIQQEVLPAALVEQELPAALRPLGRLALPHLKALIVMTEDEAMASNEVRLDRRHVNALGMPRLRVRHRYTSRDLARRHVLIDEAARILRAAGAVLTFARSVDTFTHALGTVRMGVDRRTSALDRDGRFRGFVNLYVADGSALPTSAAVNPSLTIAAHASRVAAGLVGLSRGFERDARAERAEAEHAHA